MIQSKLKSFENKECGPVKTMTLVGKITHVLQRQAATGELQDYWRTEANNYADRKRIQYAVVSLRVCRGEDNSPRTPPTTKGADK